MFCQRAVAVNMIIKAAIILLVLFHHDASAENKTKVYKELFKRTIIGYDCSQINNITSHKTTEIEDCEDDIIHKVRTNIEVQILQKTDKFANDALTCSMRRTKKVSHCGSYHHSLNLNSEEMTYQTIPISKEECQSMHKYKSVKLGQHNKRYNIEPNKENVIKYYMKGWQAPGEDIMGTQLWCDGDTHAFIGSDFVERKVDHIVIHHEDVIVIGNTTLLIENQDIIDSTNRRVLSCRKEKETCNFDNIRYIWKLDEPDCNLYQIKSLQGQIATDATSELFTANNSLIELDIKERITFCSRNLYKTTFSNIFVLKINEEQPIEQKIEPIHISILTDVSVRDKYIYSRLKQILKKT